MSDDVLPRPGVGGVRHFFVAVVHDDDVVIVDDARQWGSQGANTNDDGTTVPG